MSTVERAPGRKAPRAFETAPELLDGLDIKAAATLIAAASDIALVLDADGVIRDISLGSEDLSGEGLLGWAGRRFAETLSHDSVDKAAAMLAEAGSGAPSRWRHINHVLPNGHELPVRYMALKLGRGRTVLLGRELQALVGLQQRLTLAEQAMARDYQRITSAEARYRMLFQTSSEPVLIAEPTGWRILEANPALASLVSRKPKDMAGAEVLTLFAPESRADAETLLAAVRLTARADDVIVKLGNGAETFRLSAMLFRQENTVRCLVRLLRTERDGAGPLAQDPRRIVSVVDNLPEGFVITGLDRRIRLANAAFLDLAQISIPEQARGEIIERWLGRTDVDVDVLVNAVRERGALRHFATIMRGDLGARAEVEVTAVAIESDGEPCLGFTIRPTYSRTPLPSATDERELPFSASRMTELIGQLPLKNIVRETTDEVERRCILAALELTRDNRASAADMLGLSRQSLYSKLRRHGIIGAEEPDDGED